MPTRAALPATDVARPQLGVAPFATAAEVEPRVIGERHEAGADFGNGIGVTAFPL